ncbi:MAG TPA: hypothetical protein PLT65_04055 [Bacilli bacterium]|nr:hypothetical protein [Bacilli bacterium]
MTKKRKIKKQLIFNIINTLIILFFVCFYVGRLLYYYLEAEKKKNTNVDIALVDKLLDNISMIDVNNGLIDNEDGTYTYKGDSKYNYVKYSGRLFRVISIDEDKNMAMISETGETILMPGVEEYQNSYMNDWLNENDDKANTGIYFNTLNTPYEYLEDTTSCLDKVNTIEKITCEETKSYKVTLLSLSDYKRAGGADSYLSNGEDFFLVTQNDTNHYWYVASDGGLSLGKLMNETHGIRSVITLMSSTIIYGGSGSESDPFIIEKTKVDTLTDASIKDYVTFSNYKWQIIGKTEDKVKLVMDGYITEDKKEIATKYGTSNNFSTKAGNIGHYLNNDFYNSLSNKELIVESTFYYGKYSKYANFNYQDIYSNSVNCYVGLLNIGDLYINKYKNTFLMTRPYGDTDIIYVINDNNLFFTDYVTNEHSIRPVIYLGNINIASGNGTENSPYTLEVLTDE